jgi:hypothetical protein
MSAGRAKAFTKTRACPSSNDISRRRLPHGKADQIARHLASCDFCAAEQSLLSAYSQTTDEYEAAEMPVHLRRLAEALLEGKLKGSDKRSTYRKGSSLTRTEFRV